MKMISAIVVTQYILSICYVDISEWFYTLPCTRHQWYLFGHEKSVLVECQRLSKVKELFSCVIFLKAEIEPQRLA